MEVFPARAGVIHSRVCRWVKVTGFPRTRGGDPLEDACHHVAQRFSPHARG